MNTNMLTNKINKILRKHFKEDNFSGRWHIGEVDFERATKEIAEALETEIAFSKHEQYKEWRQAIDRIRELKSIIKQARANCFSNKPHKTIMGMRKNG